MQVLQADGGTLCACINAATLALIDAGIPMRDLVVSCAAGLLDGTPLVDLNYIEEGGGGPELPIAFLPNTNKISLIQMHSNKISAEHFEEILKMSEEGCRQIYDVVNRAAREHALKLCESRGVVTM
eukprot:GEZU01023209.1.p1 GENE.GEZU01023209.1~~GEZU01023209.1.p1  ORF type:complete len:126 (-),score=32.31 GEZU01023209.1:97-474(-)